MTKKYGGVISDKDFQEYRKWATEKVRLWHDRIKPDYILLTETTATPLGWLLKETWKSKYPNERVPKFFRSDIGNKRNGDESISRFYSGDNPLGESYLSARKIDKKKKILVFDEMDKSKSFRKRKGPIEFVKNGTALYDRDTKNPLQSKISAQCETLGRNVIALDSIGCKNIWTDAGMPDGYAPKFMTELNPYSDQEYSHSYLGDINPEKGRSLKGAYIKPTRKQDLNSEQRDYRIKNPYVGFLEKDPSLRKRALDFIHDLKAAGKKPLEQRVAAIIGVGSFLLSLMFLSSNLTGNVIGNLNQVLSNWIGGILFIIGLIGALFYFNKKNRKLVRSTKCAPSC
jgi:hypothetical protein